MIVVNACCRPGTEPGRVHCTTRNELSVHGDQREVKHLTHLPSTLELGRWLGYKTPSLLGVVSIEVPENTTEFGLELSPEVAKAIPIASDLICTLAKTFLEELDPA